MEAGHDFPLYQALLEELNYFVIDRLQRWLREQKYLEAVTICYIATETQARESYRKQTTSGNNGRTFMLENRFKEITTSSNMEITTILLTQETNLIYCPDAKHGKSSEEYCRSCIGRAKDGGIFGYDGWKKENQLKWCTVRNDIPFNHDICINAFQDE